MSNFCTTKLANCTLVLSEERLMRNDDVVTSRISAKRLAIGHIAETSQIEVGKMLALESNPAALAGDLEDREADIGLVSGFFGLVDPAVQLLTGTVDDLVERDVRIVLGFQIQVWEIIGWNDVALCCALLGIAHVGFAEGVLSAHVRTGVWYALKIATQGFTQEHADFALPCVSLLLGLARHCSLPIGTSDIYRQNRVRYPMVRADKEPQMDKKVRDLTVMVNVAASDKARLREFMKQELHYYNTLVEGLGPRARTFPETLLGLHKDWENLWTALAIGAHNVKAYERATEDAPLPADLEPHRKMLLGRDSKGERFLNDRMLNIMQLAGTAATIHPHVRRNMANIILEFYKDQSAKLIKRNDDAIGEEDLYSKPVELLVQHDMVTKRHLQIPRSALNAVYYYKERDLTEVYHPYSSNPLIIEGHDLENNNFWNFLIIHQQTGVEAVNSTPWVVDIKHTQVPYLIKYQDVEQPRTGRIFAAMKKRSH